MANQFEVIVDGHRQLLPFAHVDVSAGEARIAVSAAESPCGSNDGAVRIVLGAAVLGAALTKGGTVGAACEISDGEVRVWVQPHQATLRFVAGNVVAGAHLHGTLEFALAKAGSGHDVRGSGALEATVCGAPPIPAAALDIPQGKIGGSIGTEPLIPASAIAVVRHDPATGQDYLASLEFFGSPLLDCTTWPSARRGVRALGLQSIGGAADQQRFLDSPQPARLYELRLGGEVSDLPGAQSWVLFRRIDLAAGGQIEGVVGGTRRLAGKFTARVCRQ